MHERQLRLLSLKCSDMFKIFKKVENRNSAADFNKHNPREIE